MPVYDGERLAGLQIQRAGRGHGIGGAVERGAPVIAIALLLLPRVTMPPPVSVTVGPAATRPAPSPSNPVRWIAPMLSIVPSRSSVREVATTRSALLFTMFVLQSNVLARRLRGTVPVFQLAPVL
jgi:hypothetical protein